jgi:O-antigen/teichoic acid export membrane protein
MNVLKRNIVANLGGNVWTALMGLVFVPLYIHFIGIEAYGLVGIFATLLALFALIDMGLSRTLNREMARLSVLAGKAQEMRDLVRTLEVPYLGLAVLIGVVVTVLAPLIARHWVKAESLSPATVQHAVLLMGLATALCWPLSFYSGGLTGLQRQVLLNGINMAMATLRGLGAVLVLWLVSPTVEAFFTWQMVIRVIIFDEATSSLDVGSEYLVQEALQRLIKGRTTFIVAHRLSTIRNADRIVVLKNGECVELGTHDELMAKQGEFYRLKQLQIF